jgi:hypothetical protein
MNTEDIDKLITEYQQKLDALQPTLHPGGGVLPYSKIGLLNLARRKQKRFEANIMVLKLIRKQPEKMPDEKLRELLE